MSNEITITTGMQRQSATVLLRRHDFPAQRKQFDQAGVGCDDREHSIGTTEESITFTDIATNGFVLMINLDPTNYVEWGFSTTVYGGRMKLSQMAGPFFLNPGATLFLRANTAACRVRIIHYEG